MIGSVVVWQNAKKSLKNCEGGTVFAGGRSINRKAEWRHAEGIPFKRYILAFWRLEKERKPTWTASLSLKLWCFCQKHFWKSVRPCSAHSEHALEMTKNVSTATGCSRNWHKLSRYSPIHQRTLLKFSRWMMNWDRRKVKIESWTTVIMVIRGRPLIGGTVRYSIAARDVVSGQILIALVVTKRTKKRSSKSDY